MSVDGSYINENLKYRLAQVVGGYGRSREGGTWMNEIGKHDFEQTNESPAGWFPLETALVEAIFWGEMGFLLPVILHQSWV